MTTVSELKLVYTNNKKETLKVIKNRKLRAALEAELRSDEKLSEKCLWELEQNGLITRSQPQAERVSYFMVLPYHTKRFVNEWCLVDYSSRKERYAIAWYEKKLAEWEESLPLNSITEWRGEYFGAVFPEYKEDNCWAAEKVITEDANILRTAFARMTTLEYSIYLDYFWAADWFKIVAWGTCNED